MKITQKRQVNLHELIKWAWENDIKDRFQSVNSEHVSVEIGTGFVDTLFGNLYPYPDSLFEIEEEVDIDEDTKLNKIIHINGFDNAYVLKNSSINDRLESSQHENANTKFIYLQNDDGSIGDLIWANGKMVN